MSGLKIYVFHVVFEKFIKFQTFSFDLYRFGLFIYINFALLATAIKTSKKEKKIYFQPNTNVKKKMKNK